MRQNSYRGGSHGGYGSSDGSDRRWNHHGSSDASGGRKYSNRNIVHTSDNQHHHHHHHHHSSSSHGRNNAQKRQQKFSKDKSSTHGAAGWYIGTPQDRFYQNPPLSRTAWNAHFGMREFQYDHESFCNNKQNNNHAALADKDLEKTNAALTIDEKVDPEKDLREKSERKQYEGDHVVSFGGLNIGNPTLRVPKTEEKNNTTLAKLNEDQTPTSNGHSNTSNNINININAGANDESRSSSQEPDASSLSSSAAVDAKAAAEQQVPKAADNNNNISTNKISSSNAAGSIDQNYLANIPVEDLDSPQAILEIFENLFNRNIHDVSSDKLLYMRLHNCNPAMILGPNFPRVALAFGIAMYRGRYMVTPCRNINNLAKWFDLAATMSYAHRSRKLRVVFLTQQMLRVAISDETVDELLAACEDITHHVPMPTFYYNRDFTYLKSQPILTSAKGKFGSKGHGGNGFYHGSNNNSSTMNISKGKGKGGEWQLPNKQFISAQAGAAAASAAASSRAARIVEESLAIEDQHDIQNQSPKYVDHQKKYIIDDDHDHANIFCEGWNHSLKGLYNTELQQQQNPDLFTSTTSGTTTTASAAAAGSASAQRQFNAALHVQSMASMERVPQSLQALFKPSTGVAGVGVNLWSDKPFAMDVNQVYSDTADFSGGESSSQQSLFYAASFPASQSDIVSVGADQVGLFHDDGLSGGAAAAVAADPRLNYSVPIGGNVEIIESQANSGSLIVKSAESPYVRSRKAIVVNFPVNVLLREMWPEFLIPFPVAQDHAGKPLVEWKRIENPHPEFSSWHVQLTWIMPDYIPAAAGGPMEQYQVKNFAIFRRGNVIFVMDCDPLTGGVVCAPEGYGRCVVLSRLNNSSSLIWWSERFPASFANLSNDVFTALQSKMNNKLWQRAARRTVISQHRQPQAPSGLVPVEDIIITFAQQIVKVVTDQQFLHNIVQFLEDYSWAFEPVTSFELENSFGADEKLEFAETLHFQFLEIFTTFTPQIVPIPVTQDLPAELIEQCKKEFLRLMYQHFTLPPWTSTGLDAIDRNRVWELLLEGDITSFQDMLLHHKTLHLRGDNYNTITNHEVSDKIMRLPSPNCSPMSDMLCALNEQYVRHAGFERAFLKTDGQDPSVRLAWTQQPTPEFTTAYVNDGDKHHEFHFCGEIDIPFNILLEKFFTSLLLPIPHKVVKYVPSEEPNVCYAEIEMLVPWFLRILARPATVKIIRLTRHANTIFASAQNMDASNYDSATGIARRDKFDPLTSALRFALVINPLPEGRSSYKRIDAHIDSWVPVVMNKWSNTWMCRQWSHTVFQNVINYKRGCLEFDHIDPRFGGHPSGRLGVFEDASRIYSIRQALQ